VAVSLPHLDISSALLKAGGNVNAQNGAGKTPLHFVVANKNQQLLDLLLAHPKINLDFLDSDFASPLWIALLAESEDIANVLADKGCSLSLVDQDDDSFLHRAINNRSLFSAKWLFLKGVDLNHQNQKKQTPLHRAALIGLVEVVKFLLQGEDIDLNLKDYQGQTPVHLAVRSKNPKILVSILFELIFVVVIVSPNTTSLLD